MKKSSTTTFATALLVFVLLAAMQFSTPIFCADNTAGEEIVIEGESGPASFDLTGDWGTRKMDGLSGGVALSADDPGAALEFDFNGTAIAADMLVGKSGGIMAVSIDGNPTGTIDLYRSPMWSGIERTLLAGNLPAGDHKLRIEVLDENNNKSYGKLVAIDTIRVAPFNYGSISGVLECRYNKGMPVVWARVSAIKEGYETELTTGFDGAFNFSALPPGTYKLNLKKPGFIENEISDLTIAEGQALDLEQVLFDENPGARPLEYIRHPISIRPVIVRPEDKFTVDVDAPESSSGWKAALEVAGKSIDLDISKSVFNEETQRWTLTASAPAGTVSRLYGLRLSFDGGEDFQPRAVDIVSEFKDTIKIVHLTDVHVYKSEMLFDVYPELASKVNLVNPDVVVVTGDITDKSGYTDDRWPESDQFPAMLDLWNAYNNPTFVVPGNHDLSPYHKEDDYERWNRFFDSTDFSFDVGDYHFTAFDNSYTMISSGKKKAFAEDLFPEQLEWIEKDLAENANSKMRVLLYHVPLHNTDSAIKDIASKYYVKLALYGHLHMNAVDKMPNTTYVQTASTFEGNYRVVVLENGKIGAMTSKKDGISAFDMGTLDSRIKTSEDGHSFTIQVKNKSAMDINEASWTAEMPASEKYFCDNCTVKYRDDYDGKTFVTFTFDIPAKQVATAVLSAEN